MTDSGIKVIEGGVCAAKGFTANGIRCGIRKTRQKRDLSLIFSEVPASCAAVYTTNLVKGAPLGVTKANIADGKAQAVAFPVIAHQIFAVDLRADFLGLRFLHIGDPDLIRDKGEPQKGKIVVEAWADAAGVRPGQRAFPEAETHGRNRPDDAGDVQMRGVRRVVKVAERREFVLGSFHKGTRYFFKAAMISISTATPLGRLATSTQLLAGAVSLGKHSP